MLIDILFRLLDKQTIFEKAKLKEKLKDIDDERYYLSSDESVYSDNDENINHFSTGDDNELTREAIGKLKMNPFNNNDNNSQIDILEDMDEKIYSVT